MSLYELPTWRFDLTTRQTGALPRMLDELWYNRETIHRQLISHGEQLAAREKSARETLCRILQTVR
jgi:hypothetical protein